METESFFESERPEIVIVAAAKVGGIMANSSFQAEFLYENLLIQNNIIHSSHLYGVKKLIFLGSACIYPKLSKQPIKEEALLSGELEPTNEGYAIAKITGIKLCQFYYERFGNNFISLMPNNLYGPNDNFNLKTSHVLPALIRKIHTSKLELNKSVEIWGTGRPKREFIHVDDLALAVLFVLNNVNAEHIYSKGISHMNVGSGEEISIKDLASLIRTIIGYDGKLTFNTSMPDGMPRKILDSTIINKLGWKPNIKLKEGIKRTFNWYLENNYTKN